MKVRLEFLPHSPAFFERLLLVQNANSHFHADDWRSLSAPVISTDLGVRRFDAFRDFYLEHCRIADIVPLPDQIVTQWLTQDPESFHARADAALTFFGTYQAVSEAICQIFNSLLKEGSYETLILAGTVLASMSDSKARILFEQASAIAPSTTERYLAQHRLAATEIKRFSENSKGIEILHANAAELGELEQALRLNLEALALVRDGTPHAAENLLTDAKLIATRASHSGRLSHVEKSMAARYLSQIAINIAQLKVAEEEYDAAVRELTENCSYLARSAPEYLSEALSELACALYFANRFESAIQIANQAFGRLYSIGDIRSIKALREIVVASYFKLGEENKAEKAADLIESDILGFQGFDL